MVAAGRVLKLNDAAVSLHSRNVVPLCKPPTFGERLHNSGTISARFVEPVEATGIVP